MKLNRQWGSHIPVLVKVISITDGPVLELGSGIFSTPVLHWLCFHKKRELVTYEGDPNYCRYLKSFVNKSFHSIRQVTDWDKIDIERPWDVVLVDHGPASRRREEIRRLANFAKYIVVHDTQPSGEEAGEYRYDEIYPLFKYRFDYKEANPHTTVLSNFIDVTKLEI